MIESRPFGSVVSYSSSGGWGSDQVGVGTELVSVVRGADFPKALLGSLDGVPRRFEKETKVAKARLQHGDIILEISGGSVERPTGRTVFVTQGLLDQCEEPVIPASFCRLVRVDPEAADPRYCYYWLQEMHSSGRAFQYQNISTGLSNFQFPYFLEAEEIRLPPMAEQRAIARTLGVLDEKAEINWRMIGTLEELTRAIFKSWFVDFDPVCADATVPDNIRRLFPDRLVDSPIGPIPEGWPAVRLRDVLRETRERAGDMVVPEYSSTNEGLVPRSDRYTKVLSASAQKNKVVRRGDFVFGLSRRVLNFGLMHDEIGAVSPAYKVFEVVAGSIAPDLLERMIRARPTYFYGAVSASSREGQAVSVEGLGSLYAVQPSQAAQVAFRGLTAPLAECQRVLREEMSTLASLRETLLPGALSGEVRLVDES